MMSRFDAARAPAQPSPTTSRDGSGLHRKQPQPDPDAFYVRAHRRGGFCVMIDGKPTPLSRHDTAEAAAALAESLAKKANARVVVET